MNHIDDDRDYIIEEPEQEISPQELEELKSYLDYLDKEDIMEEFVVYRINDPNASWNLPK